MKKLYDLTHPINPDSSQRKFTIETIGADTVNHNVVREEEQWYIMTNIQMVSHIATHIEVPYHLFPEGKDLASMPVYHFSGPTVLLDFTDIQKRIGITRERTVQAVQKAGGVKKGDIVLCNLGYSGRYGAPAYGESPYFLPEALEHLISCGMKMMGVDAGGVELPGTHEHENHCLLFSHDIPLIENVANLDALPNQRFEVSAYPYPIQRVEAIPVRLVGAQYSYRYRPDMPYFMFSDIFVDFDGQNEDRFYYAYERPGHVSVGAREDLGVGDCCYAP